MNTMSQEAQAVLDQKKILSGISAERFHEICHALAELSPNEGDPNGMALGWLRESKNAAVTPSQPTRLTPELSRVLFDKNQTLHPDADAICQVAITKVGSSYGFSEALATFQWNRAIKAAASARG